MCLLFLYINDKAEDNEYSLVLVNVRDEFYHRPTKSAEFWENFPNIIGGRDQEKGREGGTWLGVSKTGKIATLLNILQKNSSLDSTKKGRGFLVVDYLKSSTSCESYLKKIQEEKDDYNGFLLVALEVRPEEKRVSSGFYSNFQKDGPTSLSNGYHAFGNSVPPYFWTKVKTGKQKFEEVVKSHLKVQEKEDLITKLFSLLDDPTQHPLDDEMRQQSEESDVMLLKRNCILIKIPEWNYGSRTHTIILIDNKGKVDYIEKTMKEPVNIKGNVEWSTSHHSFLLK